MKTEGGELPSSSFPTATDRICAVVAVSCLRYVPLPIINWTRLGMPYVKACGVRGESDRGRGKGVAPDLLFRNEEHNGKNCNDLDPLSDGRSPRKLMCYNYNWNDP